MRRNNAIIVTCIATIFAILFSPLIFLPFSQVNTEMENRDFSGFPSLFTQNALNSHFPQQFDAWFMDHFGLRKQLIWLNAFINVRLLNTSPEPSVIVGANDMLFLADTVDDYMGTNPLTDAEISDIEEHLTYLALSKQQYGGRVYIAFAPNKNEIYPENMPAAYQKRVDKSNVEQLNLAISRAGATFIDLKSALTHANEQIYYNTDTHFNQLGAFLAANAIKGAMGSNEMPPTTPTVHIFSGGDLARMLGLPGTLTEETPMLTASQMNFDQPFLSYEGAGESTVVMLRDSFGNNLLPFLVDSFAQVSARWEMPFDLRDSPPDADVLIVIAQRHIRAYLKQAPLCASPAINENLAHAEPMTASIAQDTRGDFATFVIEPALEHAEKCGVVIGDTVYWGAPLYDGENQDYPTRTGVYQVSLPRETLVLGGTATAFALTADGAYLSTAPIAIDQMSDGDESDETFSEFWESLFADKSEV